MKKFLAVMLLAVTFGMGNAVWAEDGDDAAEAEVVAGDETPAVEAAKVFIVGKSAKKYHKEDCKFVKEAEKKAEKAKKDESGVVEMTETEAKEKKFTACAVCFKAEKPEKAGKKAGAKETKKEE